MRVVCLLVGAGGGNQSSSFLNGAIISAGAHGPHMSQLIDSALQEHQEGRPWAGVFGFGGVWDVSVFEISPIVPVPVPVPEPVGAVQLRRSLVKLCSVRGERGEECLKRYPG